MFKRKKLQLFALLLAIIAITALSPATAFGAAAHSKGVILVLDGIKGESRDAAIKDGIDILSVSFGASLQVSAVGGGGGGKAGKASFSDVSLMKYLDAASLPLLKNLAMGKAIKDGTLYFFDGRSDKPYLSIAMKNILVTSQQTSGSGEEKLTESISLNYAQAMFTYNVFGPDGRVESTSTLNVDIEKNVFN
ncbi:type VI secretion system tube protein Hcp [Paenibacillus lycopersici]|uniref:Type VI secretion system tube protein Hcp n=1 Tax=Paenibacillus lycopersici TaxID=2704462 RepID=A0A6C0FYU5_9BACL|nr:type VI secretion system tube protein Hcp [Paenibacillus lycopersici]QHT62276.1 type VI secretion system tube protein Hcp [Paenibacillus lycopersici]